MNFLGHIALAGEASDDPRHWLGAMLPDFARMAAVRLRGVDDPACAAGIRHHHRVDARFHDDPRFRAWMGRVRRLLAPTDVPRPAVLGVAHVGVELLLDGILIERADRAGGQLPERYLTALQCLPAVIERVDCTGDGRPALRELQRRLQERGVPRAYADPPQVAEILHRILGRRPRLRYGAHHSSTIATALHQVRPDIETQAGALIRDLLAHLSA